MAVIWSAPRPGEEESVGHVRTTLTVTNRADQELAERGVIRPEEVRTVTLDSVMVDTGATLLGQAEMWFGACHDARHLAVVLLGTGRGCPLQLTACTTAVRPPVLESGATVWARLLILVWRVFNGPVCSQGHNETGAALDRY